MAAVPGLATPSAMSDTAPSPRMPERCLNCGTVVEQEYCPACGQHRGDYRRSLWRLLGDVIGETLELDGRLWQTLRAMLRPGRLTREFNEGRRRRYMSPVRLYLFISLVMFASMSIGFRVFTTLEPIDTETEVVALPVESELAKWTPRNPFEKALKDRMVELGRMPGDQAALEIVKGAIEQSPLVMFCLLPIYALLLKIVFVGTRWLYVDHLVFALHVHSVWFLCVLVAMVLPDVMASMMLVLVLVYTTIALQHAYRAGWGPTLARAFVLGTGYTVVLTVGIAVAIALGVVLG